MPAIERETMMRLSGMRGWPSVSIYLPTHRETTANEEDRIRLKNLLREVTDALMATGFRRPDAETFLADATRLTVDGLWSGGFEGLAVFVNDGTTEALRLSTPAPAQWLIGDRLYLRPLFPAWDPGDTFWALALDRKGSRLFRGDRHGVTLVELPHDVPMSLADETKYNTREPAMQFRSVSAPTPRGGGDQGIALFHGHGGEKDVDKIQLVDHLRHLENGVTRHIERKGHDPLVLLGEEYVTAAYREVNSYKSLYPVDVRGATDYLSASEVHARVLTALEPLWQERLDADLDRLVEKQSKGLASTDPEQVAEAAVAGRVDTLYFGEDSGPWGVVDRENLSVSVSCAEEPRYLRESMDATVVPDPKECGWDLVDLAAAETLLHGGSVRAFEGEDAPVNGVAAVFRY